MVWNGPNLIPPRKQLTPRCCHERCWVSATIKSRPPLLNVWRTECRRAAEITLSDGHGVSDRSAYQRRSDGDDAEGGALWPITGIDDGRSTAAGGEQAPPSLAGADGRAGGSEHWPWRRRRPYQDASTAAFQRPICYALVRFRSARPPERPHTLRTRHAAAALGRPANFFISLPACSFVSTPCRILVIHC